MSIKYFEISMNLKVDYLAKSDTPISSDLWFFYSFSATGFHMDQISVMI